MAISDITATVLRITGVSPTANSVEDGQRFVVSSVPKDLLQWAMAYAPVSADGSAIAIENDSILEVTRTGYSCREIPFSESIWANNSGSLKKATSSFPVYWIQDDGIKIAPVTDGSNSGYVYYVSFAEIDDDCDLRNAVIYHTSAHEFTKLATGKVTDWTDLVLPLPPTSPSFGDDLSISTTLPAEPVNPNFTAISDISFTANSMLGKVEGTRGDTDIKVGENVDTTGADWDNMLAGLAAPIYSKPSLSLISAPTISDLTISAVSPVSPGSPSFTSPDISSIFNPAASPPSYTAPILSLGSAPTISDLSISAIVPVVPALTATTVTETSITEPSFTPPVMSVPNFSDTNTWITTEEDSEMLAARVQEIQAKIGEYSARIAEAQGSFNKDNAIFQKDIQVAIQNAQLESAEDGTKLQKFASEVQQYQANVSKEVQEYQQNLAGDVQVWQAERTTDLQKYGSDIQNALNSFNKENVEYQAQLQQAAQEVGLVLQKENQEYAAKLQEYSAELQNYQADVSKEVQQYQQNLAGDIQVWQAERTTDLQKYGSDIQNNLNSFNSANTEYQAQVQARLAWYKSIASVSVNDSFSAKPMVALSTGSAGPSAQVNTAEEQLKFQRELQDYTLRLQKYTSEISSYQQSVASEVGEFSNNLQKNIQEYQSKVALYNSDLQKYQIEVGEKTAKTGSATQNAVYYSKEADKYYQWANAEVQMYIQNNSKIINRTIAAQAAQQQRS